MIFDFDVTPYFDPEEPQVNVAFRCGPLDADASMDLRQAVSLRNALTRAIVLAQTPPRE